jgi:hypothetical protein
VTWPCRRPVVDSSRSGFIPTLPWATWPPRSETSILVIELSELQDVGFNPELLGFEADELARMLRDELHEGLTDPDEVPEPPDDPITQPGDLWILGHHRLLDGATIQLVNTDPPYNVKVEPRRNNAIAAGNSSFATTNKHHQKFDLERHPEKAKATHKKMRAKDRPLANDFVSDEEFDRLLDAWFGTIARVLEPGRGFFIWGGYANLGNYPPFLKKHNLYFSQGIVWDKQHPVLTRKDFMGAFELSFYGWKLGAAHQLLRSEQRHRPLASQKGQSAVDRPFDGEACRTRGAGHPVFVADRRKRARFVRRRRLDAHCLRTDGAQSVPGRVGPALLRRYHPKMGAIYRALRQSCIEEIELHREIKVQIDLLFFARQELGKDPRLASLAGPLLLPFRRLLVLFLRLRRVQ